MSVFRRRHRRAHVRAGAPDATSKPVSLIPGLSMVNTEMAPTVRGPLRSRWMYIGLSVAMVAAVTSTVAAGTWATFNGTGRNTSTFVTGTVVLSNRVNTGTTCFSTSANTDSNVNTACEALFIGTGPDSPASSKRPGEYATATLHLKNEGSLSGTLGVKMESNCQVSDPDLSNQPNAGTGNACTIVQLSIAETGSNAKCYWGDNMTQSVRGA